MEKETGTSWERSGNMEKRERIIGSMEGKERRNLRRSECKRKMDERQQWLDEDETWRELRPDNVDGSITD